MMIQLNVYDCFKKANRLTKEQKEFVIDLQHSPKPVQQHGKGKIKLQSVKEFLEPP